ncbi:MAG: SUMF1/EgtB/PvdO family nonheme iron enzyme [Bacteroidales bacterium]|nr:SUMF1/EgtB/PvdO family nonheme iron enzyme [Bacteroidales bacterium]MDD3664670.1 SUMF1/EgtB/PvdO family nonheme iron enzyme [Bacteroidales bacterium]
MRYTFAVLFFGMYLMLTSVVANNIQVGNIAIVEQNTTAKQSLVQFDLTWENSWRTSNLNGAGVTNWDAAWIFVKFRVGSGEWQHAKLDATRHQTGTGTAATIDAGLLDPKTAFNATTNPAVGVFVYRQSDGTGAFIQNGIKICWNYGVNGVTDDATVDIKVFAIEMVYVPEGAFYVGSGGTESGSFTDGSWAGGAPIPLSISSENELPVASTAGSLWGVSTVGYNTIGPAGSLPSAFPKGFMAFYCMKYEVTQSQYAEFLNTLTRVQQNTLTQANLSAGVSSVTVRNIMVTPLPASPTIYSLHRNGISVDATFDPNNPVTVYCDLNGNGIPNESDDGQWLPCNFLTCMDGAAYTDWAGLRPMTELEFEKASRGVLNPVVDEFVWGTSDVIFGNRYLITNSGAINEAISVAFNTSGLGNVNYISSYPSAVLDYRGLMRVGIFSGNIQNTGRVSSGASFYGVMELSGNLFERTVTVGKEVGRLFEGNHGDGQISVNGFANQESWPGMQAGELSTANGICFRGGGWNASLGYLRVSSRISASAEDDAYRKNFSGFRAVRSKP